MKVTFKIDNEELMYRGDFAPSFSIKSVPFDYDVNIIENGKNFNWLKNLVKESHNCLFYIDKHVYSILKSYVDFENHPVLICDAIEQNKNINTALHLCDFLQANNGNRGSMVYVIGGGITQDLGAYACKTMKRGIPWTFVPTTLLSQCDSCIGGKTAINHGNAKNILGLFSAPQKVYIDTQFLDTLQVNEVISGFGEVLKLCITGGNSTLSTFQSNIQDGLAHNKKSLAHLIQTSLYVKKLVVERDEFELNLRKAMNYGHSIGHAIEILSEYKIPHGIAVVYGLLVENVLAYSQNLLCLEIVEEIVGVAKNILTDDFNKIFAHLDVNNMLYLLMNDKKVYGTTLKVATLKGIGDTIFLNLSLDEKGVAQVKEAINFVRRQLSCPTTC